MALAMIIPLAESFCFDINGPMSRTDWFQTLAHADIVSNGNPI